MSFAVQLLSLILLFSTPWTAACQASLSFTISQSLVKLMSIELVMPSNHLILCCPLLLLPSIFPSVRPCSDGRKPPTPLLTTGQGPPSHGFFFFKFKQMRSSAWGHHTLLISATPDLEARPSGFFLYLFFSAEHPLVHGRSWV